MLNSDMGSVPVEGRLIETPLESNAISKACKMRAPELSYGHFPQELLFVWTVDQM